eukprot:554765-Pyramimonas_sp.AAC.1
MAHDGQIRPRWPPTCLPIKRPQKGAKRPQGASAPPKNAPKRDDVLSFSCHCTFPHFPDQGNSPVHRCWM